MATQQLAAANNKFGVDLFKTIFVEKSTDNMFFSPFSISAAVAMTHLGAKEITAVGIASALRWQTDKEDVIHQQFQAYLTKLLAASNNFSLSSANRIYMQQNYKILDEFKEMTKTLYLAEAVNADFASNAEVERLKINDWVSKETQDKIKDLIGAGCLDRLTKMIIVNAIYFKGKWEEEFDEKWTQLQSFKLSPGQAKSVPMMSTKKKYAVSVNNYLKCSAIEIPYKNKDLSMVVVLPSEDFGLQDLIKKLDHAALDCLLRDLGHSRGDVNLALPKFEMTSSHRLKEALSTLGMSNAFSAEAANFSGITGNRDLFISAVVHKAFIKVNEEGTEAAAATAMIMAPTCATLPFSFIVDHPFLYIIRDNRANGLILFMGAVVDPSSQ